MDREIKFRAWHPLLCDMFENVVIADGKALRRGYFATDLNTDFSDKLIVMQYTGLKDKNGKAIYEGDILTAEEYIWKDGGRFNYHGEVVFRDAAFFVKAHCVNPKRQGISDGLFYDFFDADFEIIGNIYENPELLTNN